MACEFDKGLIAAHYDGETTSDERAQVERHLASCPECARDLASMKDLSAALKPLARAVVPISIAEGVLKEIGPVRSAPRPWVQWGLSAAASLLVAFGALFFFTRDRSAPNLNVAASEHKAPAAKPLPLTGRDDAAAEREYRQSGVKPAADPAPTFATPPAPPLAEEPGRLSRDEEAPKEEKDKEESAQGARMAAKVAEPAVPVIRVKAPDVAVARAVVEAFLKEREIKLVPGAPLLGRTAYVRDHYLQLDLTTEEAALLDKRIAELKDTSTLRTTLDVEKKRLAEHLAKAKPMTDALGGAKSEDSDAVEGKAGELEEKTDRSRRAATPLEMDRKKLARPVRVIYLFEPAETKR